MATIVQSYGPIYGEPVNGTVSGRPNGSVYVPTTNSISISADEGLTVKRGSARRLLLSGRYQYNAESQDLSSSIRVSLYEDADCSVRFGSGSYVLPAGDFNGDAQAVGYSETDPTSGTKYYVRADLVSNGTVVASSEILEVTGL